MSAAAVKLGLTEEGDAAQGPGRGPQAGPRAGRSDGRERDRDQLLPRGPAARRPEVAPAGVPRGVAGAGRAGPGPGREVHRPGLRLDSHRAPSTWMRVTSRIRAYAHVQGARPAAWPRPAAAPGRGRAPGGPSVPRRRRAARRRAAPPRPGPRPGRGPGRGCRRPGPGPRWARSTAGSAATAARTAAMTAGSSSGSALRAALGEREQRGAGQLVRRRGPPGRAPACRPSRARRPAAPGAAVRRRGGRSGPSGRASRWR